jgi:hypothetical protein
MVAAGLRAFDFDGIPKTWVGQIVVFGLSGRYFAPHLFCFPAAPLGLDQAGFGAPGPPGFSAAFARGPGEGIKLSHPRRPGDFVCKPATGFHTVHRLRARGRNRHAESRRDVAEGDGCRDLVDMLSARAAGAGELLNDILIAKGRHAGDFHVGFVISQDL